MVSVRHYLVIFSILITIASSCNQEPSDQKGETDLTNIAYSPSEYKIDYPSDFPKPATIPDNPLSDEGVQLGRHLFYDPILSSDSSLSCASCHNPRTAFTDNVAFSKGVTGELGSRSSMSVLNAVYASKGYFWDGRAATLEDQALQPVENPVELHEQWPNVEDKLRRHPLYPAMFRKAFGIQSRKEISKELAAKAISQFERILITGQNSIYFKQKRGEIFFSDDEQTGHDMFFDLDPLLQDAECNHCHAVPFFTANDFFNNGLDSAASYSEFKDPGRGKITGVSADTGKFKAPTLFNIALTAPYMKDGRFKTLEEVVEHYNSGGHGSPNKNPLIYPLRLSNKQKKQLISFLKTLTDTTYLQNPDIFSPF